jgi:hypothetical protein
MSEAKTEVPKLNILEQLKQQHGQFVQQRDFAQNNLNQLIGAIYACEVMIKKHEEQDAQTGLSQECLGDKEHGEADNQEKK